MTKIRDIGFTLLGQDSSPRGPYELNVILVHGLRGHPERTWGQLSHSHEEAETGKSPKIRRSLTALYRHTRQGQSSGKSETSPKPFWPEEFLVPDTPKARVWTYGYNANVIEGVFQANNSNSISQHGRDLAVQFECDIDNEDPVVFIAHSLGGIIVKDAIRRSEICRCRTKAIAFLGTPHRGSPVAGWGIIASNLASLALQDSNKTLVRGLEVNSEVLDNIQEQFVQIVLETRMKIHSFQEARGISGVKGLSGKVVEDMSSKLDLPFGIQTVESIDADHRQMTKFIDKDDAGYRAIVGILKQLLSPPRGAPLFAHARSDPMLTGPSAYFDVVETHFLVPFPPNRRFVGRAELLETLQQKLFADQTFQKIALVGLGGVGKTQIALQVAYWVKENMPEYSVFWVPVLSSVSFEQAYLQIMKSCGIQKVPNEDLKELVCQYLSSQRSGKWLMVVDNADDLEIVRGSSNNEGGIYRFLPHSQDGRILFTTRFQTMAVSVANNSVLKVSELSTQDAERQLKEALIEPGLLQDQKALSGLLDALTRLPLALSQAASYINETNITVSEYLELFNNTDQDMIELLSAGFQDDTRYAQTQDPIAKTWFISFNQIGKVNRFAQEILLFAAYIEPRDIPKSMLPQGESQQQLTRAIGILCGYGFLNRREDRKSFDMHRLVHLAIRIWAEEKQITASAHIRVLSGLAHIYPHWDWENRYIWRQYHPHACRILSNFDGYSNDSQCTLLLKVGLCLGRDKYCEESLGFTRQAVSVATYLYPNQADVRRLHAQFCLSRALADAEDIISAFEMINHVVAIGRGILTETDINLLNWKMLLAILLKEVGQVESSIKLNEHLIRVEHIHAGNSLVPLALRHNLAMSYNSCGQQDQAIAILEDIVSTKKRILPKNDIGILSSQHSLFRVYGDCGRLNDSLEVVHEIVTTEEFIYRTDHPHLLSHQEDLAMVYSHIGRFGEAIRLLTHVLKVRQRTLPEDSPVAIRIKIALADLCGRNGNTDNCDAISGDDVSELEILDERLCIPGSMCSYGVLKVRDGGGDCDENPLKIRDPVAITYHGNAELNRAMEKFEQIAEIKRGSSNSKVDVPAPRYVICQSQRVCSVYGIGDIRGKTREYSTGY